MSMNNNNNNTISSSPSLALTLSHQNEDLIVQAIIHRRQDQSSMSSDETFNRMKCVDEFSSLMKQYIQLEQSIKEGSSIENIKTEQLHCIHQLNQYQYNTSILLSSLSQDYEQQLQEIQDRLQKVKTQIHEHKNDIIPSLNQELENQRKYKQFNEEYNLISENILKKPSTQELQHQKQLSLDQVERMKQEGDEKKKKIEYYEKQMELLFVATSDLLSTFKVQ
ncbi:hypothetical protein C9374_014557 [Naegleria lovaniensis]|uniref:Uncharacterized protein n=1 Tax=Naegleria lovaniensis TaxID=51637 RepID=A0AA88KUF1_NAELO|nr:uncharacterized protein C9374_014557 [Naegleria lovaniensis]KAG2389157.1 hypothetical protein C9374_014557 [Naegleria lovaniensis]